MLPVTAYFYFFVTFYVFGTGVSNSHFVIYFLASLFALVPCYFVFAAKITQIDYKSSFSYETRNLPYYVKALVICLILFRIYEIFYYGIDAFSATADSINIYGAKDYYLGFKQIINTMVNFFITAYLIKYSMESYYSNSKTLSPYHYMYFLLLPFLYASRGGVLIFIYIYLLFKKVRFSKFALYALIFVLIAAVFGENRIYFMSGKEYESPPLIEMILKHITGESAVSQAYNLIVTQASTELGTQYGKTIFAPFLLKIIPRHFIPEKPVNTSAVIMSHYFPEEWAANLALAPTFLGDIYFNFSFIPTIMFVYFFTILSCFFWIKFRALQYEIGSTMSICCVSFFVNYFTLLRNNLSDSLFAFLLSFSTLYIVFHWRKIMIFVPRSSH